MTDRKRLGGQDADSEQCWTCLLEQARYAIDAGVDVFQVRERDVASTVLARIVAAIVRMARGSSTRVVVNDRLDVALACEADGVHLPAESLPPVRVRAIAPPGFIVGRSVHSEGEASAMSGSSDYLIAGTVWPTESKQGQTMVIGPSGLAAIVRASSVPVLAIGGVTLDRVAQAAQAGAAGVAAIGMFMGVGGTRCRALPLESIASSARAQFDTSRTAS